MKKLFTTLIIILMMQAVEAAKIQNYTVYNIQPYCEQVANALHLPDSIIVQIIPVNDLIRNRYPAVCKQVSGKVYTIRVVKGPMDDMMLYIAHEMVHIQQMVTGRLVLAGDGTFTFDNVRQKNDINMHWYDRHEREAREKGILLFHQYRTPHL